MAGGRAKARGFISDPPLTLDADLTMAENQIG